MKYKKSIIIIMLLLMTFMINMKSSIEVDAAPTNAFGLRLTNSSSYIYDTNNWSTIRSYMTGRTSGDYTLELNNANVSISGENRMTWTISGSAPNVTVTSSYDYDNSMRLRGGTILRLVSTDGSNKRLYSNSADFALFFVGTGSRLVVGENVTIEAADVTIRGDGKSTTDSYVDIYGEVSDNSSATGVSIDDYSSYSGPVDHTATVYGDLVINVYENGTLSRASLSRSGSRNYIHYGGIYNSTSLPSQTRYEMAYFNPQTDEQFASEWSSSLTSADLRHSDETEKFSKDYYTQIGWSLDSDGSTLLGNYNQTISISSPLKIYPHYSPNEYSIEFNSNGGTNVSNITETYNVQITEPSNPTRLGYTFDDWYIDNGSFENAFVFDVMPGNGAILYANWIINQYTMTFDTNGGGIIDEVTLDYQSILDVDDPTREGYTFSGWTATNYQGTVTEDYQITTMPASDMSLVANWTVNPYDLTFIDYNGDLIQETTYDYDTNIANHTLPADPTREGYTFVGWDISVPDHMPANNVEISALYDINQYQVNRTINGDTTSDSLIFDYEETIELPSQTKEGYSFVGWYNEPTFDTEFNITSMPANDLNIYAKWTINEYAISFDSNEGSLVNEIRQNYNTEISRPINPLKNGYTFLGWYEDDMLLTPYVFDTMPSEDITVYAKWNINTYYINYALNGGTNDSQNPINYQVTRSEDITLVSPIRNGYDFMGWYELSDFSDTGISTIDVDRAEPIYLYAKWSIKTYNIMYELNGGLNFISYKVTDGMIPLSTPTRTGYTFGGWYETSNYSGDALQQIDSTRAENLSIYPKWDINSYVLTIRDDDNSLISQETYEFDQNIVAVNQPVRLGYTFNGWSQAIPQYMPASNINIYATWTANEQVLLYLDYNDEILYTERFFTDEFLNEVIAPNDPTREGFDFSGWDKELPNQMTPQDYIIRATYNVKTYQVNFESNNGSLVDSQSYDFGEQVLVPTNPIREGYTFNGWYQDETLTNLYMFDSMPAEDITIYAKWSYRNYQINYITTHQLIVANPNQATYKLSDGVIDLFAVTSANHTFAGWFDNPYFLGDKITSINSNQMGDITLYAKWTISLRQISFESNGGTQRNALIQAIGTTVNEPIAPTREGYTFDGWFKDQQLSETFLFNIMPDENVTLYAKWTVNTYKFKLIDYDGTILMDDSFAYNHPITGVVEPSREGYTFVYWEFNIPDNMPAQDLSIQAFYEINTYQIQFKQNNGLDDLLSSVIYLEEVERPLDPTKEGYTFAGWYEDELLTINYKFSNEVTGNMNLYAKWQVNEYKVYLHNNINNEVIEYSFNYLDDIENITALKLEGYTFYEWNEEVPTVMPASDIHLTGMYQVNQYDIEFITNGGTNIDQLTFDYLENIIIEQEPTREEYLFDGWYLDEGMQDAFDLELMPARNVTLYAKWRLNLGVNISDELIVNESEINDDVLHMDIDDRFDVSISYKDTLTGNTIDRVEAEELIKKRMSVTVIYDISDGVVSEHFEVRIDIKDDVSPIINGVQHQEIIVRDGYVEIDFNEGIALLNGKIIESGHRIYRVGNYDLVITDAAGNTTVSEFEIVLDETHYMALSATPIFGISMLVLFLKRKKSKLWRIV